MCFDIIWIMNYSANIIVFFCILFLFKTGLSEWKEISQSEKGTYYVDYGSVRLIDEGIRSVWVLINFKQKIKRAKSRQLKLEMDCQSKEMRIKSLYSYTGFFLGGVPIKDYYKTEEWRSIDTDEDLQMVFRRFCKKSS